MNPRALAVPLGLMLLGLSGCTAKYQDLLRDRDMHIRELEDNLAELRATNADLERRERSARDEAARLRTATTPRPEPKDDLARVQGALSDLDVRYNRGRISIGIENTVTFGSGSVSLKSSADSVLRRVADLLRRDFGDRRIYIEGHTDTDPIRKTKDKYRNNRHLSSERADSVADYLIRKGGIDPAQVVVVGFGPYDPRDPSGNDSAKARNRRVEIVVGEPL